MSTQHPQQIGKYKVISVLGRGGMGIVYKAHDPVIDRIVAIKTISTTEAVEEGEEYLITRLKMEARSAGRLHHPNVVTIFDFGEQDGVAYIVMEYVEGRNMALMIRQKRPMALAKKLDILIQIANGLAYAHDLGVVHRDMKPSNVCVTVKDVAKILDFGLARLDTTRLTRTGFMTGTIAYMSPERIKGESGISDDIFALGSVAYEFLTNQRTFDGTTPPEVIYQIMQHQPAAPSSVADLPEEIDPILMHALEKDPKKRYQSALELSTTLQKFRESSALRDFVSDERRTAELERQVSTFVDTQKSGATPYSAAMMTPPAPAEGNPPEATPTEVMRETDVHPAGMTMRQPLPDADLTARDQTLREYAMETHTTMPEGLGDSSLPTTEVTALSAASREAAGMPAKRRWMIPVIAAAIILPLLAFAALKLGKPTPPPAAVTRPVPPPPTGTVPPTVEAPENWGLQRALLKSLSDDVARLKLSREQRLRVQEARATGVLAAEKFEQRDYESSSRLMSTAIDGLRTILDTVEQTEGEAKPDPAAMIAWQDLQRSVRSKLAAASRRGVVVSAQQQARLGRRVEELRSLAEEGRTGAVRSTAESIVRAYDEAITQAAAELAPRKAAVEPVIPGPETATPSPSRVEPEPAKVAARPAPTPSKPAEDPKREVAEFVARMTRAYQGRDADFFRQNYLKYTESMGKAIQSAPSIRVELEITSIELIDSSTADVTVTRTDVFPGGDAPAVQRLVYRLVRSGGSWKIASFARG